MVHAASLPIPPVEPGGGGAAERARKVARFAVQPRLVGAFARAAYRGALEVAARLAAAATPDPQRALLADMYIHWQHAVPYRVADAGQATQMEGEQLRILIARLCRQNMIRRSSGGSLRQPLHAETHIELTPACRAELGGQYARIQASEANGKG